MTTDMPMTLRASQIQATILRFVSWLDNFGETSYDHQSYFAGGLGGAAKALYYRNRILGTLAVSPMILSEALVPSARTLFWKKQRFPIADAHYAMGFAFLSRVLNDRTQYQRAVHFLDVLKQTRSAGYSLYCWGYPFDWQTRHGILKAETPFITTLPYAYEAFEAVYKIDGDGQWLEIMRSIAEHGLRDYRDISISATSSSCAYTPAPDDPGYVVNASAYRGFLLTKASVDFSNDEYHAVAKKNLNYVLESQNSDGSWYYSTEGERDFVDHFHTCFVLKALAKVEALTPRPEYTNAIERGVKYYVDNLFDDHGWPKPFSRRPRLTVYRNELYDIAECINLATLLRGRFPTLDAILTEILNLSEWMKLDGSFRSRRLLIGWDNTPMHRWAQSQMFRSLCQYLHSTLGDAHSE